MNTLEKTRKEEYWRDYINRWRQSGLSRKQYCKTEKISYWSFRVHFKKIEQPETGKLVKVPRLAYLHGKTDESGLVADKVCCSAKHPGIEIVIQEKISIRLRSGFDGELLRNVLTELGVRI